MTYQRKQRTGHFPQMVVATIAALLPSVCGPQGFGDEPPPGYVWDENGFPIRERADVRGVPGPLHRVKAEWIRDKDRKIVGVDFDGMNGVDGRGVGKAEFEHLAELQNLQFVGGHGDDIADDWMTALGKLRGLRELRLIHADITSKGIEHISNLRELRRLDLRYTHVDDTACGIIAGFEKLEELNLSETEVADLGVVALMNLKNLRVLSIGRSSMGPRITRACEGALCNMKSLRKLDIRETSFDQDGIAVLKKFLPDCEITAPRGE